MAVVVSHESAMRYWESYCGGAPKHTRIAESDAHGVSAEAVSNLRVLGFPCSAEEPTDCSVPAASKRSKAAGFRAHVMSYSVVPYAVRVTDDVYVVTPELCFVQVASRLSLARLLLFGFSICGTYGVSSDGSLFRRGALTHVSAIAALAERLPSHEVPRQVRVALRFLLDGAASPSETRLCLLLMLSSAYGGFGLPRPVLNAPVVLSDASRAIYPHRECRADLYWPGVKLDLEYNGQAEHAGRGEEDSARASALAIEGVRVIAVTRRQVNSPSVFEALAKKLGKLIGSPVRTQRLDFAERHMKLRQELGLPT